MPGNSLKPFGARTPLGELPFSLIDYAKIVIIDYTPGLKRALAQVPEIIERQTLRTHCMIEMRHSDREIADTPCAQRRFHILKPVDSGS